MSTIYERGFVLGNGPTLPSVNVLSSLRGEFTIGTTRILRSGFTPTAIIVADTKFWTNPKNALDKALLEDTDAIVFACCSVEPRGSNWVKMPSFIERDCFDDMRGRIDCLLLSGSTGTAAARWLLHLCERVVMLGCSAAPGEDGRSDFYGDNPDHVEGTMDKLAAQRAQLVEDFGSGDDPRVIFADTDDDHAEWKQYVAAPQHDAQVFYRAAIRFLLRGLKWGGSWR